MVPLIDYIVLATVSNLGHLREASVTVTVIFPVVPVIT
jgi:hypothetical protein